MKADPDSATSPSKYGSDKDSDSAAETSSPSVARKKTSVATNMSKKKTLPNLPKVQSMSTMHQDPPPLSPGGKTLSKKDLDEAEKVLMKSQAAIHRGIINKDIQTFLHKSKSNFHIADVKHAMDNARIIARSESTSEFEPNR